jgi:hypothetical protein
MKMLKSHIACLAVLSFIMMPMVAISAPISKDAACKLLTTQALRQHFVAKPAPPGHYYCDIDSPSDGYFIIGLHYSYKAAAETFGSNLVGWYAVRQIDGRIFEWDMPNMHLGRPVPDG